MPPFVTSVKDIDYFIHRSAVEITACLEKWLKVPLDYNGTYIPALMMLNYYEGPIWMHPGQGQEIGPLRDVVKTIKRARRHLKQAKQLVLQGAHEEVEQEIQRALSPLKKLPPPVSIWIESSSARTVSEHDEFLKYLQVLHEGYILARNGKGGHRRARRVAIALRAIFEVHTDIEIKAGNTDRVPEGTYAKCLQEVLSWAGINVDFLQYAHEARKCPDNDETLLTLKHILKNPEIVLPTTE